MDELIFALRLIGILLGIIILGPIFLVLAIILIPLLILNGILYVFLGFIEWSFRGESMILDEIKKTYKQIKKEYL